MIKTVEEVCTYINGVIDSFPYCVETGSTYCVEESNLIHTTTNNIANKICLPSRGKLVSVDIDPEHQELARTICDPEALVIFITGDSVDILSSSLVLSDQKKIDLLWLDSKEFDEDHAVKEYNAVKEHLSEKHFVCVDDIHNSNSVKYKKIVPILKGLGYSFMEIDTPVGLFFAAKGYSLPDQEF